jgi:hypothetical protein
MLWHNANMLSSPLYSTDNFTLCVKSKQLLQIVTLLKIFLSWLPVRVPVPKPSETDPDRVKHRLPKIMRVLLRNTGCSLPMYLHNFKYFFCYTE